MKTIQLLVFLFVSSFLIGCEKEPPTILEFPVKTKISITEDSKEHFVQYDDDGNINLLSTENAIATDDPISYVWVFDEMEEKIKLYSPDHEKVGELFPETIGKIEGQTEFRENGLSTNEVKDLSVNGSKEKMKEIFDTAPLLDDPGVITVNPGSGICAQLPRPSGLDKYPVEIWEYIYVNGILVMENPISVQWLP